MIVLVFVKKLRLNDVGWVTGPARPRGTSTKKLLDLGQELIGLHRLPGLDLQLFNDAGSGRHDRNLHFHRLHDDDDLILFHAVARFFLDFENFSNHRCGDGCCQGFSPLLEAVGDNERNGYLSFSRVSAQLSNPRSAASRTTLLLSGSEVSPRMALTAGGASQLRCNRFSIRCTVDTLEAPRLVHRSFDPPPAVHSKSEGGC